MVENMSNVNVNLINLNHYFKLLVQILTLSEKLVIFLYLYF